MVQPLSAPTRRSQDCSKNAINWSYLRKGGTSIILKRLEKAYGINKVNHIYHDLAEFLNYSWKKSVSVEYFISGFHARVDKIADFNLDDKLKGHIFLRQADLANHDRHVVIGTSSGLHEVNFVSAVLRSILRKRPTTEETMRCGESPSYREEIDKHTI